MVLGVVIYNHSKGKRKDRAEKTQCPINSKQNTYNVFSLYHMNIEKSITTWGCKGFDRDMKIIISLV